MTSSLIHFCFDQASCLWTRETNVDHVSNHMLVAMKAVGGGAFFHGLSDAERKYVGSVRGGMAVLRRSLNALRDARFESQLDANMRILPFDNGLYDLDARAFRRMRWDDYVSTTIGYSYSETPDVADVELVDRFFEQVFPVEEERELVMRMAGSTLGGAPVNKRFLVLQDHRGGDNGKSMVLQAFLAALGRFSLANQNQFLSVASRPDPNGHQANTLAYKGKRLAVFDETDPSVRFDLAKMKAITGGSTTIAVRGANEATVTEFRWTAFLMIACNKGCLPSIDSSDAAFLNRMVTVPMRSKFNDAAAAAGTPLSFPMDNNLQEKLRNARQAIVQVLIRAYGRYEDAGRSFGELPTSCLELRASIVSDSDPRVELVNTVIDRVVDFRPIAQGPEVPAVRFVERADILEEVSKSDKDNVTKKVKKCVMKDIVDAAMAARGHPPEERVKVNGKGFYNVYKDCSRRVKTEGERGEN